MYAGNRDKLNPLTLGGTLTGIKFVKLTMLNPQVPNAAGVACTDAATAAPTRTTTPASRPTAAPARTTGSVAASSWT